MEQARRTSIVDEEMRQRRVQELVAGASSSGPISGAVSITHGAHKSGGRCHP